jgi:hypothetical protein
MLLPGANTNYQAFERTVSAFTADAYIGIPPNLTFGDAGESTLFDIATSLDPARVMRADKGTSDIGSGKNLILAPEPPTQIMVLVGVGLVAVSLRRRSPRRAGRRKVREDERSMASI